MFLLLDYSRERVVAGKGSKNVYRQTHGTTEHITMLCCASAAGFSLPPMIIFAESFPGGPTVLRAPMTLSMREVNRGGLTVS